MGLPASRVLGSTLCPTHGCGNICLSSNNVQTNSRGQVRGGDAVICLCGPRDYVVTGSGTVLVNSEPAARLTDKTAHAGASMDASGNVHIGGPRVGAMVGDLGAVAACREASKTRHVKGARDQGYNNCGLESIRAIINRSRAERGLPPISEDELLKEAVAEGMTEGSTDINSGKRLAGATSMEDLTRLLNKYGVPASRQPVNRDGILAAVGEDRGVVVYVRQYWYWPASAGAKLDAAHAITIVGIAYDDNGKPRGYIINDTGLGECGRFVPLNELEQAMPPDVPIIVTDHPQPKAPPPHANP
jgi:uncharacterized Zn-binding protein involved in type VI secretion